MTNKLRKIKARTTWVQIYEQLGSISKAARRCGIPRSTLYRWVNRYKTEGVDGLKDKSQRPNKLGKLKLTTDIEKLIISLRQKHKFGPKRINITLIRNYNINLSPSTIWRILKKHNIPAIKRYRKRDNYKRYNRPIPGDRVQIDVTKIRKNCYQFTAVDDCTRLRVLRLYQNKTAENAILFLYEILDNFPFPIQRIQSDWGTEFFNYVFQEELMQHFIKFRPIKPRSPHLNGKVERSQQTDKVEFYNLLNLKDPKLELSKLLAEWEYFYNHKRPHSALDDKTPWEKFEELESKVPIQPEVTGNYWNSNEQILPRSSKFLKWQNNLSHLY